MHGSYSLFYHPKFISFWLEPCAFASASNPLSHRLKSDMHLILKMYQLMSLDIVVKEFFHVFTFPSLPDSATLFMVTFSPSGNTFLFIPSSISMRHHCQA